MKNLYLQDSFIKEIRTSVESIRTVKKKPAICLQENIFYPGGGGQPFDKGIVEFSDRQVNVLRIIKQDGLIFACLEEKISIEEGEKVHAKVDWERRFNFMRYHTAAHVLLGAVKRAITHYYPKEINISEEGESCVVSFEGDWNAETVEVNKIISRANSIISKKSEVAVMSYDDVQQVVNDFKELYRGPDHLNGQVRIINITDWDVNPCGGTHVSNLSDIGEINLEGYTHDSIIFSLKQG